MSHNRNERILKIKLFINELRSSNPPPWAQEESAANLQWCLEQMDDDVQLMAGLENHRDYISRELSKALIKIEESSIPSKGKPNGEEN